MLVGDGGDGGGGGGSGSSQRYCIVTLYLIMSVGFSGLFQSVYKLHVSVSVFFLQQNGYSRIPLEWRGTGLEEL